MAVEITTGSSSVTATIEGEIDHHTSRDIREAIDAAVSRVKPERLVLDFSQVSFMDSSGIGLIMGRYRMMCELGGKVSIKGAGESTRRMIRLAGLSKLNIAME